MKTPSLNPARFTAETYGAYRARRAAVLAGIRKHLRGRLIYTSSGIVEIPIAGADTQTDEAIAARRLRRVTPPTLNSVGALVRRACLKGTTYRKGAK